MNASTKQLLLLGSLGIASGIALSSCVDPYVAHHGPYPSHGGYRAGYEVHSLPPGYRTEVIEGNRYYVHGGTYYRQHSGRYVVVDAPRPHYSHPSSHRDVVITSLPPGYRVVQRGGVHYYQSNGVYYQRRGPGYIVVDRPY